MTPTDRNGNTVQIGTHVRLLSLSSKWLEELPPDERNDILSMVGEAFKVYEIDEYGQPWVEKWRHDEDGTSRSHSIALEPHEIEIVDSP